MVFTITSDTDPTLLLSEELLSGRVYELYARMLFLELFEQDQELLPLLLTGYVPDFAPIYLEHIDPSGEFDHARGSLRIEKLGPSAFLYTVKFFCARRLVTLAVLNGRLRKGCI